MSVPPDPLSDRPAAPRRPWRAVVLLSAAVALAHALLLDLIPAGIDRDPVPLGGRFSTRTIVLVPPELTRQPTADSTAASVPKQPAPKPARPAAVQPPAANAAVRAGPSRRGTKAPQPAINAIDAPSEPAPQDRTTGAQSAPRGTLEAPPDTVAAMAETTQTAAAAPAPGEPLQPGASSTAADAAEPRAIAPDEDATPDGRDDGASATRDTGSGTDPSVSAQEATSAAAGRGAGGAGAPDVGGVDRSATPPRAADSSAATETLGTGPRAMRIPASVRLRFAVTGQQGSTPMQGMFGELAWLHNGEEYDAQLALTFLFRTVRSQRSSGHLGADGLAPDRFADTRRTEQASHFVRERAQVVFSNNKPPQPLLPGAQDRLSVMIQLGALLAGDASSFPVGADIAVQTVGPGDADVWRFRIEADETLDLPAGPYQARKLARAPRREFDDRVEIWLAPQLGHLPVRLRITQPNGDFADFQLRGVSPVGPPS